LKKIGKKEKVSSSMDSIYWNKELSWLLIVD
jgi:hypothetical protein